MSDDANWRLRAYARGLLDWTIERMVPSWETDDDRRRDRRESNLIEFRHSLGKFIAKFSAQATVAEIQEDFLDPIFRLEDEECFALLAPFADFAICALVLDGRDIPASTVPVLERVADRLLADNEFKPTSNYGGTLHGWDMPSLIKGLLFVSHSNLGGCARFANGDWTELPVVMPIVDRIVRAGGWIADVMTHYLMLCERSGAIYPAETFADQVLHVLESYSDHLGSWRDTLIPASIAALVQRHAEEQAPLPQPLARKLLRVLDHLVNLGDRRSAALQIGDSFRDVRLEPSQGPNFIAAAR